MASLNNSPLFVCLFCLFVYLFVVFSWHDHWTEQGLVRVYIFMVIYQGYLLHLQVIEQISTTTFLLSLALVLISFYFNKINESTKSYHTDTTHTNKQCFIHWWKSSTLTHTALHIVWPDRYSEPWCCQSFKEWLATLLLLQKLTGCGIHFLTWEVINGQALYYFPFTICRNSHWVRVHNAFWNTIGRTIRAYTHGHIHTLWTDMTRDEISNKIINYFLVLFQTMSK